MLATGASWNASLPIAAVGTWPQITTIGIESAMQSRTGRDGVGRARAGGHDAHADLAGRARIARRHEARALLVGRHDQRHRLPAARLRVRLVVDEDRVVGRQDRAAAVAEDGVDALVGEHLDDDLGAGHLLAGERVGGCARGAQRRFSFTADPHSAGKR